MTDQLYADGQQAAKQTQTITEEAKNVRERVRQVIVDLVRKRKLSIDELSGIANQMMDGAMEGARKAVPDKRESALHQAVDGIADGYKIAANATKLAFDEAKARGKEFAEKDVDKALKDLRAAEKKFVDAVTHAAGKAKKELAGEAKDLKQHAQRAAESIRPSLEAAINAATKQTGKLASETATASLAATREAAGSLLQAMSGLLQGAADVVTGKDQAKK